MVVSDSLTLKTLDLDTKIAIPSDLVQKLWSKAYFRKMVENIMRSHTSNMFKLLNIFFNLLKDFY